MQNALAAVPGVRQARVDLESGTAIVTFDPQQTDANALEATVEKAGFKAKASSATTPSRGDT